MLSRISINVGTPRIWYLDATSGFLSTINDDQYSTKLLIYNALVARAIGREGTDYVIEGKGTIGYNLNEVVDYMNNPANNEDVLKVKARIENAK